MHKKHTLTSRSMQCWNQSMQERVFSPILEEFQNIFFRPSKKIKTRTTQTETDRQISKQTMTLKPNNDNGLQGRRTEHQLPTAALRNGGCSGKFKVCFSNQLLWWVDSEVLQNPPLRKAAKRYAAA